MEISRPISKQPIPNHAKKVFEGIIFDIYQWKQKQFDGSTAIFEKAKRKVDSVNVLPITKENKIIITKQEQPSELPFYGAIGGRVDEGESPLDTAKRELKEESGYEARKYEPLLSIQPEIKVDWACYTFIAKEIEKVSKMNLDAGEKIQLVELTFDEYMDIIIEDNYRDSEHTLFFLKAKYSNKLSEVKKKMLN